MKYLKRAAITVSLMLYASASPALAFISPHCSTEEPAVIVVTGEDDPNIPNCVMYPEEPYPGGVCERVMVWMNPSTTEKPCTSIG